MIITLIQIVQFVARVLSLLVIVDIVLSYFMSPWHTIRMTLDRIVGPMLAPIRKVVPPLGMVDLSPLVLIILIQVVEYLIIRLLIYFA